MAKRNNMTLPLPLHSADEMELQIVEKQRTIDYDTKEFTVELLVAKLDAGDFFIPKYQREFVWSEDRQSRFIESVLLGLPIPFLFMADTTEGTLEIVDGAQRLRTLSAFMKDKLRLRNIEELDLLERSTFSELPPAQQRKFKNRTLRMIVLSDRTTADSKFNIFERINTGSDALKHAELRKGAFSGPFYDLVDECAGKANFIELCPIGKGPARRREREELVLRFFAYSESYEHFQHDVTKFLNSYIKAKNSAYKAASAKGDLEKTDKRQAFLNMLEFVKRFFPAGFAKTRNAKTTPRVRFEAISVGVHLALKQNPNLVPKSMDWIHSKEFSRQTTTHASNSAPKLQGRIRYVRDSLLGTSS